MDRVLLVEDDKDLQEYLGEVIEEEGFEVLKANNGKEALEKLKFDNNIQLVLTDFMMPEMDGIELCDKLKSTTLTSHIPVIVITANENKEHRYRGLMIGADDYIQKPFDSYELTLKIKSQIELRKKLNERLKSEFSLDPAKPEIKSFEEEFMTKVMEIIEDNLDNTEFNVETMYREVAMSRSLFYNTMMEITGQSGKEFLNNIRVKRAVQLLAETDIDITQIAYKIGFKDQKYFSRFFKKAMGVSPSSFRKNAHTQSLPLQIRCFTIKNLV